MSAISISTQLMGAIHSSWFSWTSHKKLQEDLLALPFDQLRDMLDPVLMEDNTLTTLERLSALIPLKKLEQAAFVGDARKAVQDVRELAHYYFHDTQTSLSAQLASYASSLYRALLSLLEALIACCDLSSTFKPAETDLEAEFKSQRILMLISLFSSLSGILVPVLGAEAVGTLIGVPLLVIAALSVIYPWIKPLPATLPRAENWSQQAREGQLQVAQGRKSCLDQIARCLIQNQNTALKTHAMLLGKSGVGKTETVRAFVQAIHQGQYPELQGKEVFYINSADLVMAREYSSENKSLIKIREAMGRHREQIILILDEIHLVCQKREDSALADQLKTLLDQGPNSLPHVIGITTEEEFYRDIWGDNSAFARRFQRIAIENTSELETLETLNNILARQAPHVLVVPDVSRTLLRKVTQAFGSQAAQPATAVKILLRCIQKTLQSQITPLEQQINDLHSQIRCAHSQRLVGHFPVSTGGLQQDLARLEGIWQKHKQGLDALYRTQRRLATVKIEILRASLQISPSATAYDLSHFLLLRYFLMPALEREIRRAGEALQVTTCIDSALIDTVIAEEQQTERRVQEMIRQGQHQVSARKELS